ncbi:MAG: lasso peptide isopeptide bond-forming cyclase [bacterium]|nr:lasso peptide isopeptide bond-forming cyclase [bacterium]
MSAIVGFLGLDGRPAKAEELERMVEILAHRGPDGRAIRVKGSVGLGHCMLHTTPESLNEHLPFERDGLAITADARIDNREELINLLILKTHQPEQISDSELILYAYRRWGEECPEHLLGDFAFTVWDPVKQHLFCARDHFGVKPFYYYYQSGRRFVFATEIKAIFCYEDIPKQLNEIKISDYMLEMFEDKARTFYMNINRLPPASVMMINKSGIRQREYWALDSKQEVKLKSDTEYAEAYRSLFIEAVRCRLRSAFPIGSMLSGGLDSSSIACVAHDLLMDCDKKNLHTFSIIFNKIKESDEREYIYKVLEKRNFTAHFIEGDQVTPFDDLDKTLWFQDEPFYAPNLFLNWQVWSTAQKSGVRILLDGILGDNIISHGIEYLHELANRWRWLTLAHELKQLINQSDLNISLGRILCDYFLQKGIKPYIPEVGLQLWRYLRGYPIDQNVNYLRIFQGDFSIRIGLRERLEKRYKYDRAQKSGRRVHYNSLNNGMIQTALEVYNRGCNAFNIETCFPFSDRRLVEFCLALPGNQKVNRGHTRIIARRAMHQILPEEISWRANKGNLGWNFRNGIKNSKEILCSALESSDSILGTILDIRTLKKMHTRYEKSSAVEVESMILFLFVVLTTWRNRLETITARPDIYN